MELYAIPGLSYDWNDHTLGGKKQKQFLKTQCYVIAYDFQMQMDLTLNFAKVQRVYLDVKMLSKLAHSKFYTPFINPQT